MVPIHYHVFVNSKVSHLSIDKYNGELGRDFIEVHHVKPLYMTNGEQEVDLKTDLVPVCPNCHRMIHRKKSEILSVEDLQKIVKLNK